MIKTNSKKAIENIKNYVMENYTPGNYDDDETKVTFEDRAAFILKVFRDEAKAASFDDTQQGFIEWCAGLPSILDTCYYYNRSAKADLGGILEETAEERDKYTESEAERLLSILIYRELLKGEAKVK